MAKAMIDAELVGEKLTPDQLRAIDIFKDVKADQLARFPGAVVRRRFKAGEVVCREGEGGTTAFYIVSGSARVFIGSRGEAARRRKKGGFIAAIGRIFGQKRVTHTPTHSADKLIPIDASVDLPYGSLAATLEAGGLFGEMSCLNLAPRSATVVAQGECEMLEILRNVFELLQKSPTFKKKMDDQYRQRSLAVHLRSVPLFDGMSAADIEVLKERAQLVLVDAGQVIFREDDAADDATTGGMYLIRSGQVKVSHHAAGGERTLAYLTKGEWFGETGLLRGAHRNATCKAVDHPIFENGVKRRPWRVEMVRISPQDFHEIIVKYPLIKGRLEKLAEQRTRHGKKLEETISTSAPSRQVEDLGLLQGQNLMLIDLTKCTRCDQCVDACVSSHDDGVTRLIREGPRFDKFLVPSSCRMCMDPVCMIGCPVGSIRRAEDLNMLIEDWCVGCGLCAKQCPYDSIQMHALEEFGEEVSDEFKRIAEGGKVVAVTERAAVCDQCSSLPTGPACVSACPHDAAFRVDAATFLGTPAAANR